MKSSLVTLSALSLAAGARAYLVDPPTTAAPDTAEECSNWMVAENSSTCEEIAEYNWITVTQLKRWVSNIFCANPTYVNIELTIVFYIDRIRLSAPPAPSLSVSPTALKRTGVPLKRRSPRPPPQSLPVRPPLRLLVTALSRLRRPRRA